MIVWVIIFALDGSAFHRRLFSVWVSRTSKEEFAMLCFMRGCEVWFTYGISTRFAACCAGLRRLDDDILRPVIYYTLGLGFAPPPTNDNTITFNVVGIPQRVECVPCFFCFFLVNLERLGLPTYLPTSLSSLEWPSSKFALLALFPGQGGSPTRGHSGS